MNNIIYSPEIGIKLNEKIQRDIAGHLFLTCNYESKFMKVFSEDAKFLEAVLNLYKFLIDSGIVNNLSNIGKKYREIKYDYKGLKEIIDNVNSLRTFLAHNESEVSANNQAEIRAGAWLKSIIGKPIPDSLADYSKLKAELERMGSKAVRILEDFLSSASRVPKQAEMVKDWEKLIIQFYRSSNSSNIIKGQLRNLYIAKQVMGRNYSYTSSSVSERDIAEWVKQMYYKEQLELINALTMNTPRNASVTLRAQINNKIEQYRVDIDKKTQQIALEVKKTPQELENNVYLYLDYYICRFPKKIKELVDANRMQEFGTLLPQDVVQYIINKDF